MRKNLSKIVIKANLKKKKGDCMFRRNDFTSVSEEEVKERYYHAHHNAY